VEVTGTSWLTDKLISPISFQRDQLGCLGSEVELKFGLDLIGWDLILLSYLQHVDCFFLKLSSVSPRDGHGGEKQRN
jgi:hypothetical protein